MLATLSTSALAEDDGSTSPAPPSDGTPPPRPDCPATATIQCVLDAGSDHAIDMAKADVRVQLNHKIDIDDEEDGCINEVRIESSVLDRGCALRLVYRAVPEADELRLVEGHLEADSFCPGWPAHREGLYTWESGLDAPTLHLSTEAVPDRTADRSCVDLSMELTGTLGTAQEGVRGSTPFAVESLQITGTFDSVGDAKGLCPSSSAPLPASSPSPSPLQPLLSRMRESTPGASRTGQWVVELSTGVVIGDVDRVYDARLVLNQVGNATFEETGRYQYEPIRRLRARPGSLGGHRPRLRAAALAGGRSLSWIPARTTPPDHRLGANLAGRVRLPGD